MATNIMSTNIVTPTIPMHAASASTGKAAVAIFVADIYLIVIMTRG